VKEAQILKGCVFNERSRYVKSIYDALSDDDRNAYRKGEVPTIKAPALANAPAPAAAPASAKAVGKEAMEMDIETDSDDDDMNYDDHILQLQKHFKCFDESLLTAYSIWIIEQLEGPWMNVVHTKNQVFFNMCSKNAGIYNMNLVNEQLQNTFKGYLSKPCFLSDVLWDEEVVSAFAEWQRKVPSATLDIFRPDSDLHNCTVHDFKEVQVRMNQFLKSSSSSIDSQTFATELLIFCAMQDGNGSELNTSEYSRQEWLHRVAGQLVPRNRPDQAYA